MKRWLMRPCSSDDGTILCYVDRDRSSFGMLGGTCVYRMFLEDTSERGGAKFLMAAKKMTGKRTSYYLVSAEMDPDDRGSMYVLGKVRSNNVGSRYYFMDHGLPPDKTVAPNMLRKANAPTSISSPRLTYSSLSLNTRACLLQELGLVDFEFDSGGPSKIQGWIPHVTPSGVVQVWQPA
jgi:hypothetical protein